MYLCIDAVRACLHFTHTHTHIPRFYEFNHPSKGKTCFGDLFRRLHCFSGMSNQTQSLMKIKFQDRKIQRIIYSMHFELRQNYSRIKWMNLRRKILGMHETWLNMEMIFLNFLYMKKLQKMVFWISMTPEKSPWTILFYYVCFVSFFR